MPIFYRDWVMLEIGFLELNDTDVSIEDVVS